MAAALQGIVIFFFYMWTGQLGLPFTYWIVGLLGNFTVFLLPLALFDDLGQEMNRAQIYHLVVCALYYLVSSICVARAMGYRKRPKTWPF